MAKIKRAARKAARADRAVTHRAAAHDDGTVLGRLGDLTELADQPPLILLCAGVIATGAMTHDRHLLRGGVRMLAAHLVATAAKAVIKKSVIRTRPTQAMKSGHRFEAGEDDRSEVNSFPSGHTAGAVAVSQAVGRDFASLAAPSMLAAISVAAAQAPRGKHYVSDVIAGAAIGWVAEKLVSALMERVERRFKRDDLPLAVRAE